MSRPLLEWTVRNRLATHPNVTIRAGVAADGIDLDPAARRVVGVGLDDSTTLPCDLVVDATGRHARTLGWLEALGYPEPTVSRVEVDTRYLSQELRRTVGGDFAYPDTTGPKPPGTDLINRYIERVIVAGRHHDAVAIRFNEVVAIPAGPKRSWHQASSSGSYASHAEQGVMRPARRRTSQQRP